MASNNFDQNIKSKLENRAIKPSENAWDKLSDKLDAQDNRKSYNGYWRLGIAASIVIILFFTIRGFDNNAVEKNPPIIVDSEVNIKVDNHNNTEVETPESINPIIDKSIVIEESEKQQHIVNVKKETIIQPKEKEVLIVEENTVNITETIAEADNTPIKDPQEANTVEPISISYEEQKIQEVVVQIHGLENRSGGVSDAEIDELLAQAENQIKSKRLYNESTKTVNANSLLQEVEEDLDLSFRNKVLEALRASYENVKVAVTNRNE